MPAAGVTATPLTVIAKTIGRYKKGERVTVSLRISLNGYSVSPMLDDAQTETRCET
jgi:hypothetical protein